MREHDTPGGERAARLLAHTYRADLEAIAQVLATVEQAFRRSPDHDDSVRADAVADAIEDVRHAIERLGIACRE